MGESNNFFEILGNPNYSRQQEQVVRSLRVTDVAELLPQKTFIFYKNNIDHKGLLQEENKDESGSLLMLYNHFKVG